PGIEAQPLHDDGLQLVQHFLLGHPAPFVMMRLATSPRHAPVSPSGSGCPSWRRRAPSANGATANMSPSSLAPPRPGPPRAAPEPGPPTPRLEPEPRRPLDQRRSRPPSRARVEVRALLERL